MCPSAMAANLSRQRDGAACCLPPQTLIRNTWTDALWPQGSLISHPQGPTVQLLSQPSHQHVHFAHARKLCKSTTDQAEAGAARVSRVSRPPVSSVWAPQALNWTSANHCPGGYCHVDTNVRAALAIYSAATAGAQGSKLTRHCPRAPRPQEKAA